MREELERRAGWAVRVPPEREQVAEEVTEEEGQRVATVAEVAEDRPSGLSRWRELLQL